MYGLRTVYGIQKTVALFEKGEERRREESNRASCTTLLTIAS